MVNYDQNILKKYADGLYVLAIVWAISLGLIFSGLAVSLSDAVVALFSDRYNVGQYYSRDWRYFIYCIIGLIFGGTLGWSGSFLLRFIAQIVLCFSRIEEHLNALRENSMITSVSGIDKSKGDPDSNGAV